jgi:ubiquinone biosynthesis protein
MVEIALVLSGYFVAMAFLYATCRMLNQRTAFGRYAGKSLAWAVELLGPGAMKIAQIASARPDLIPATMAASLSTLQDKAAIPSNRAIRSQFYKLFPGELDARFSTVDWTPIAAGSIAFVLFARNLEGADIALKIVRPGVRKRLVVDLITLNCIVRLLRVFSSFDSTRLAELMPHLSAIALAQCSMQREAENIRKFSRFCGKGMVVPSVHDSLCSEDVLAMSFVRASKSIVSEEISKERYQAVCLELLDEVYRMVFVHGLVHCDLHPGNVRIDSDGKLVLLDFGLFSELNERERRSFRSLFFGLATEDAVLVSQTILENSKQELTEEKVMLFEKSVECLLIKWSKRKAGEFLVFSFIRDLFDLQRQFGLFGAPPFVSAIWALGLFEGLVRTRFPDLNFQSRAIKVLFSPYENNRAIE